MKSCFFKISVITILISFLFSLFSEVILADSDFSSASSMAVSDISASSAVLMLADSNSIVFEKNANQKLPMASTTKIMTAIVAIENGDLSKTVAVSPSAVGIEGSSIYLYKNERILLEDLLYALLLKSANDAACAIAIEVGKSTDGFVAMMNKKAVELGLKNTHFTNPHGLFDENHYTSAYDLACILSYALNNETFKTMISTYKKTISSSDTTRLLINHNKLLKSYDGIIGGKTGYTKKSGRCLVNAASRNGINLICVTLNDPNDWREHKELFDYGFSIYEGITFEKRGEISYVSHIVGGTSMTITGIVKEDINATLKKGENDIISITEMQRFYYPPIKKGDRIGYRVYYLDNVEISRTEIISDCDVYLAQDNRSFFKKLYDFIT